jgi:hypothetical protein
VVDMHRGSVVVDLYILPGTSDEKAPQDLAHKLVIMVCMCIHDTCHHGMYVYIHIVRVSEFERGTMFEQIHSCVH